jgi:urease accessory protein
MSWLALQLADSAFPAGGFAHSGGLEAAAQAGEVPDLMRFLRDLIWQTGHGALPLASAAHQRPGDLAALDARADAFLLNQVANRASRLQGRAFLQTCALSFDRLAPLREETRALCRHHAPLFGAALQRLGIELEEMQRLLLFGTLRAAVSAAVRLALAGTHEAQTLQARLAPSLEEAFVQCAALREPVQTAPLIELLQGTHDRLYSRLFIS